MGRENAIMAVILTADGGTNIVEELQKRARVLEERLERNPIASIVLLFDGKDTYNDMNYNHCPENQIFSDPIHVLEYLNPLPIFICPTGATQNEGHPPTFSIYRFGFGLDHDSSDMHSISNASDDEKEFLVNLSIIAFAGVEVVEGIAAEQQMAEMGNLEKAQAVLTNMKAAILSSALTEDGNSLYS
ncbi:Hypothetical predicted protein [Olea europaea subsp. europaea]|uniref:Uncharacterized protein n=1 Tax=Olea europaea subsp. europaea TaxID=158383 RepID=A0A8S0U281_OLEEU|nr:Hypothetical predicted protein [Olea europaea subsp. europaea]